MNNLIDSGLETSMRNAFQSEKRLVGICLGMHLFAEIGFEGGKTNTNRSKKTYKKMKKQRKLTKMKKQRNRKTQKRSSI
jgi:imidazoleglycerol phosphate synthase glutamine amidotransferase subunit HisH